VAHEREKSTGPSIVDLPGGRFGERTGLVPPHADRRQGGAVTKPANGAAPGRYPDAVAAKNRRMVASWLEEIGKRGVLTADDHEFLDKFWDGPPLDLGQKPATDKEIKAAREAKIIAMIMAAVETGRIVLGEFLDLAELEKALSNAMVHAAARELVEQRDRDALEEAARARRGAYPMWRSAGALMADDTQLAQPIIWDPVTGEVAQREGQTARLLADGKGGKTSVGLQWCRSALTGEPWLGHFHVRKVAPGAAVAFVDPELDADAGWYLRRAMRGLDPAVVDQRLRHIDLIALKNEGGWTWASEEDRNWLADTQLAGCERLFADSILSFLPAGGAGESSHSLDAVGQFLDQFKAMQRRAGIRDVLVGIHRAKSGTGSFGSIQWDAKFQALWSITVEDGGQVRKLRGEPGRAGTRFREAEIAQEPDGRLRFRAADVVGQIVADAQREAEALAPALAAFPEVMGERFWNHGDDPGKDDALGAVSDALKAKGGAGISKRHYASFWAAVEQDGLAVLGKVPGRNKIAVSRPRNG
jgi:hypothetical protein